MIKYAKITAAVVMLCLALTAPCYAVNYQPSGAERELIIRAVASSYPDVDYAERVGICAVLLNRMASEDYPNTAGGVIASFIAEGEFACFDGSAGHIAEKLLRLTSDALDCALNGADPSGGMMNFITADRLVEARGRVDFDFDDTYEDGVMRSKISGLRRRARGGDMLLIDKIGFWE